MKKVVLDTNILLVSLSKKSSLYWIFEKLIYQEYTLCVSTDILLEYEEIISQKMGYQAVIYFMDIIENLPNVQKISKSYNFNLLKDADDNKFVDVAIISNADFIVTHDKDFNTLGTIAFPKVNCINTIEFKKEIENPPNDFIDINYLT